MNRKLWAASDGNGGYDIGEGDFTIASVRNLEREDGRQVARLYRQTLDYAPRDTAMMFKAAPEMLAALEAGEGYLANHANRGDPAAQGLVAMFCAAIARAKGI